jgi:hypothetical protein
LILKKKKSAKKSRKNKIKVEEHPGMIIDEAWIEAEKVVDSEAILCQAMDWDMFWFYWLRSGCYIRGIL